MAVNWERKENGISEAKNSKREWSKKQKRGYHRIRSLLYFWEKHGYRVRWVMLSTSETGDPKKLTYNHKRLRQRIQLKFGYRRIEYYQVRTEEGNGVLHIFWAWKPERGERARSFYIPQEWISEQWQEIHGASVVWISEYKHGQKSRNRVSRYIISQYVQDQYGYVNMSWSWKNSLGFPMGRVWEILKNRWSDWDLRCKSKGRPGIPRPVLYRTWENLLAGEAIFYGEGIVQLVPGRGLLWQSL